MAHGQLIGTDAIADKGWWRAHQWLLLRRLSQMFILALFLSGPWFGIWLVKGNLASSLTLDVLPLTDPYVLLQSVFAGHIPEMVAITGGLIVLAVYLLVGGRAYCSWVCPVNVITDVAAWLQDRLGIKTGVMLQRNTRHWILAMTLLLAMVTGGIVWELVNPVSVVFRGLVFGFGFGWMVMLAVFMFDLLVSRRGWCGHLCPMGAFYSHLNRLSLLRVHADKREACNDCMDCFAVCPEPQIIKSALKGHTMTPVKGPMIASSQCTNCGRCIDICGKEVFSFNTRFKTYTNEFNFNKEGD